MPALDFLLTQTVSNIQFLVSQNALPPSDGEAILFLLNKVTAKPTNHSPSSSLSSDSSALSSSLASSPGARTLPTLPSPRPANFHVKALWPYNQNGEMTNDLTFRCGDVIQVTGEINSEWYSGVLKGRSGLVPAAYVERTSPPMAPIGKPTLRQSPPNSSSAVYDSSKVDPFPAALSTHRHSTSLTNMTIDGGFGLASAATIPRSSIFNPSSLSSSPKTAPFRGLPPRLAPAQPPRQQQQQQTERYTLYETPPPPPRLFNTNQPIGHGRQSTAQF